MEDYKELIALLDGAMAMTASNGKIEKAELFCKAAEAIEQLVKERDAAIAEIPKNCNTCGRFFWDKDCVECKWEWRGVQKESE